MTATETRPGIGGSDVAAILGLSPWRTPLDVWREKLLGEDDDVDNAATQAGNRFEPFIIHAYAQTLPDGSEVASAPQKAEGIHRATVDAIATVRGWQRIVEAKSTMFPADWGDPGTDEVPPYYMAQGQWYMHLWEMEECDYPVLKFPRDPRAMRGLLGLEPEEVVRRIGIATYTVPYSRRIAHHIRDEVDRFWEVHVLGETPPPARDLEDAKRLVWTKPKSYVDMGADLSRLLREYEAAKAAEKKAETARERAEFALREAVGSAESIRANGREVASLRVTKRKGYTQNVKPSSFRTIRFTKHWSPDQ